LVEKVKQRNDITREHEKLQAKGSREGWLN